MPAQLTSGEGNLMLNRREALAAMAALPAAAQAQRGRRRNVIFILTDDHRHDALGFLKAQPWLETPQLARLAREGAHFKNAFVTTALCSPRRASILTGVYAHKHRIVDNNTPIPESTVFFRCSFHRTCSCAGPRR
jgi:N-acetylglucosamine-6-sulfatase